MVVNVFLLIHQTAESNFRIFLVHSHGARIHGQFISAETFFHVGFMKIKNIFGREIHHAQKTGERFFSQ